MLKLYLPLGKNRIIACLTTFLLWFLVAIISANETFAQDCSYWHDSVGVKSVEYSGGKIDERDSAKILEGIECLLKLEGDKSRGAFSGATSNKVSQSFPRATVEICALYYISYLFYEKYDHADGIALVDRKSHEINTDEIMKKAYESYRKWFVEVKRIGLVEARSQKLDPLECSDVGWY